jgi:drug/metabolite transporter (DMT)-like permease
LLALLSTVGIGFDSALVKLAGREGLSSASVLVFKAFFALGCLTLVLPAMAAVERAQAPAAKHKRLGRSEVLHVLVGGLFFALANIGLTTGFLLAAAANVLSFFALAPVWGALISWPLLGERPLLRTIAAATMSLVGAAMIAAGIALDADDSNGAVLGSMLGLFAGLALAGYLITIRGAAARTPLTPTQLIPVTGFIIVVVVGLAPTPVLHGEGQALLPASQRGLAWLALNGIFSMALPFMLNSVAARLVRPAEVALIMQLKLVLGPVFVVRRMRPGARVARRRSAALTAPLARSHTVLALRSLPSLKRSPGSSPWWAELSYASRSSAMACSVRASRAVSARARQGTRRTRLRWSVWSPPLIVGRSSSALPRRHDSRPPCSQSRSVIF